MHIVRMKQAFTTAFNLLCFSLAASGILAPLLSAAAQSR
jgi:hypothetical protein